MLEPGLQSPNGRAVDPIVVIRSRNGLDLLGLSPARLTLPMDQGKKSKVAGIFLALALQDGIWQLDFPAIPVNGSHGERIKRKSYFAFTCGQLVI